jgi:enolase
MMEAQVKRVHFRGILESRGKLTVEAELELQDGSLGLASSPVAIAPGRREQRRSFIQALGPLDGDDGEEIFRKLRHRIEGGRFNSQAHFDSFVEQIPAAAELGADVRLVLSVAFCRASSKSRGISLLEQLVQLVQSSGSRPAVPRPLVNIFSGGVHDASCKVPFQQIMFTPDFGNIRANIEAGLAVYAAVEERLEESGREFRHSASSGMQLSGVSHIELLQELDEVIGQLKYPREKACLAIDVAAEHLRTENGCYRFGTATISGAELFERLKEIVRSYNVQFLEDPFDPSDEDLWRASATQLSPSTVVVGDDLFSTNSANIKPGLATGILLKLNQVGSVTGALQAAATARQAGLTLCVSHRSGETEDTVMCDLAVALGATYIKVGGPRRGDRIAKYNQLIRLAEQLGVSMGSI